jgi:DNA repair photolyase
MIISASRRTDIPAFYTEWFMNRIREGFLYTRNPFNAHQIKKVSLLRQDVEAIVFWTRNPEKLIPYLNELDEKEHNYYFQYTITGYPRTLEKSVPNPNRSIDTFIKLSDRVGDGKVVWRYDPILLSNYVGIDDHKRLFSKIAQSLEGKTKRVVISFADLYKKTERNLKAVEGLVYNDITSNNETILELSEFMAKTALQHGMSIKSCAEEIDLLSVGIKHGKCIDEEILKLEFELSLNPKKDSGQRDACGCIKSIDIGEYNTCLHGCSYCYATFNEKTVVKNKQQHEPSSPFLVGNLDEKERRLLSLDAVEQQSIF